MISEKSTLPELVQDALAVIHEQYPYLYGSGDLAELLQVSSPHLIRVFKKATGQSPTQYLIAYKLAQSKGFLMQENFYIDTVANVVGFSCGNYYAKVFRKHYGITPSEYIQENRGKTAPEEPHRPEMYL